MLIGKPGPAATSICTASADRIEVRGRDLCADLMGRLTFTEYFYLLVTGREPGPQRTRFLDMLLIAIAEHGLTPTAQAARMTIAAAPDALQAAVAAGILGCGPVVLGTSELCGRLLVEAAGRIDKGTAPSEVAAAIASEYREARTPFPGFGHPVHKPVDPRAVRILDEAEARGVGGRHVAFARLLPDAVAAAWGKPLPMNVSLPIAAVLLDLDFPPAMIKAIPILARTAGLLAHLAEEQERPVGFLMAAQGEAAIVYEQGSDHQ